MRSKAAFIHSYIVILYCAELVRSMVRPTDRPGLFNEPIYARNATSITSHFYTMSLGLP